MIDLKKLSHRDYSMGLENSNKALREFAYTMSAAFIGIFCIALPFLFSRSIPHWPFFIAAILLLQALLAPRTLIPVRYLWMRIGGMIGWINTRIILAVVFYVLLTPIGLIQRRWGKSQYNVGYNNQLNSYKITRQKKLTATDLENPF